MRPWVCLCASVALAERPAFYLVAGWQSAFNGTLSTDCSADVLNEFFSSASLGIGGAAGDGIDLRGNYVVGKTIAKHCGLGQADDPAAQTGMGRWPLTFAAGHPYYSGSGGGSSWGALKGGSWKQFVADVGKPITFPQQPAAVLKDSVLVVENLDGAPPSPLVLTGSTLELMGIVVRKGGNGGC